MRFVDLTKLELPPGWEERAQRALQEVSDLDDDNRASVISRRKAIWTVLRPELGKLSDKKCWYCEVKVKPERSDVPIDHFRPKNRVNKKDCEGHPGYWWLAFDWKNFRYSCTHCNSSHHDTTTDMTGGKADRFPLRDEAKRCRTPADLLSEEQPVLLDPTVITDPGLLWFDDDGSAHPKYLKSTAPWPYRRARESIDIYHLNHSNLKEARQIVCNKCRRKVVEGDEAWKDLSKGSIRAEEQFKKAVEDLGEFMDENAEYSAAARATVMGLRSADRPWLDTVLTSI